MYNEYFGFRENPFSIAPDPRFLYLSEMHQDGLAHLKNGLSPESCIVLLTGEVGTGKTTLCSFFLEQLEPTANVALITNPGISGFELLITLCDEFMVRVSDDAFTHKQYFDALNEFLLETHADNNPALLVIDEAQNLDKDALEKIRLLTDLEANNKKLLKIFLLGQAELATRLRSPDQTQVNQRITGRFHLAGLHANETGKYITHRLKVAGGNGEKLFNDRAVKRIHHLTRGVPRLINSLCDRTLIAAYEESLELVDESIVKKAAREIFGFDHTSKTMEIPVNSLLAGALTMCAIVLIWVGTTSDIFHLNLSSILPPPQKSETAPSSIPQQDSIESRLNQENGQLTDKEVDEGEEGRTTETILSEEQTSSAADEETEVATLAAEEEPVAKADEKPGQSNIFIAPVEFSDRREQEPATRITINSIEINE